MAAWVRLLTSILRSSVLTAILNLHERIENKLFLDRTRKDSNFKRPHICATLFQTEKCCYRPEVIDIGDLVVTAPIADAGLIHLPRQPLPTVDVDLDLVGCPVCNRTCIQPNSGSIR